MDKDFMKKKFGVSGINREMFIDCFSEPISMCCVSDEMMEKLAGDVEDHIKKKYPEVADEMFKVWSEPNFTYKDYDVLTRKYKDAFNDYWKTLEKMAKELVFDEEILNDMLSDIENFQSDIKTLKSKIINILDNLSCNKHLTKQLLSINFKLSEVIDDFSYIKPDIKILCLKK